ncbi:DUF7738 domain-containing protein [Tenacibaculum caenipelagi]|uniref:DUF7738 domain-containing protein n=1 Tax=Tenacibaculum caenipelagi TaxID=1325435 RepID=A0A4R6TGL9_9FLAO|nr:hypothetical protein [Tenacibaculum caenipelagi]TDQ27869.1 hypothetical protein DFQ07_1726 [Tenacibaculum caenipelagi]
MLSFFKKKKVKDLVIKCDTDIIHIDDKPLTFPTSYDALTQILGSPSRELKKSNNYIIWDQYGIFCGCTDNDNILSINIYQNKKDKSEYNTKQQFKGKLFLNDDEITNTEFGKIPLGKVAIHRLGSENEIRFGFSIGVNRDYREL